ncbi:hypothetical protein ACFZB5_14060 [Streptomyces nodosus]|uniref:hypothetical protein n=1 Tax=Streptomyces nodosus TaxID=40318 RepID=UPI0036DFD1A1
MNGFKTTWRNISMPANPATGKPTQKALRAVWAGKSVAESAFGCWVNLLDKGGTRGDGPYRKNVDYDSTLWRKALHKAFPNSDGELLFSETVVPTVHGQRSLYTGPLGQNSNQSYRYDKAGRVVKAEDDAVDAVCVTRSYAFDKNSGRKTLATSAAQPGLECTISGAMTVNQDTATVKFCSGEVPRAQGTGQLRNHRPPRLLNGAGPVTTEESEGPGTHPRCHSSSAQTVSSASSLVAVPRIRLCPRARSTRAAGPPHGARR